jgi:hypothetical protein
MGVVVAWGVPAAAAQAEDLAKRQAFFYALPPGVTEEDVVAAVGKPDTTFRGGPAYRLTTGFAVVHAKGGRIVRCEHHTPSASLPDHSRRLYWAPPALPSDEALRALEQRVAKRAFAGAVDLGRDAYRTERHPGAECHQLADGYLCVEYAIDPFSSFGAFHRVLARATAYRRSALHSEVLWRAADHWADARPSGLTDAELDRREAVVRLHGTNLHRHVQDLGPPDGGWGSGIPRGVYYLRDGLLTVDLLDGGRAPAELSQPGAERQLALEAWLAR